MTFLQLNEYARTWPIFTVQDCVKWFPSARRKAILLNLTRYTASGLLVRLRRGLYLLNREPYPDSFVIASRLDPSAIISVETVLHRAGMIPEIPFATTSVTPAITARYHPSVGGSFVFRHIKPPLLFGFSVERYASYSVKIAHPEKALLDLFWFHRFERDIAAYCNELRIDIPVNFSWKNFYAYTELFASTQVTKFAQYMKKHYS
ncbi:type IV toxin-antitoxin system AbiEi family antitoxin domain-containing protein [Candidatus Uhrbacteria bacterium]|nr:type IV toxin-antitoxin system AbiEi family antitoxin domain-containing protein [Candidatus Uhrbacteria bacterium]